MRSVEGAVRSLARRRRSLPYLLGLAVVLAALYWPAVSLRGFFYVGDIFRLNYPARVAYAQALRQGRLPLWKPDALAGYPILADGQMGALYPPNLILYRVLPPHVALNCSLLLSFWIAGAGLFLYARSLGLRRGPAFLAGCILMLGGFFPAHLNHVSMLDAVAWLPLLLLSVERATRAAHWRAWLSVAAIFGLQGLAGHPQVLLLSALLAAAHALAGPLAASPAPFRLPRQAQQLALCVGALAVGALLATPQLVPTYELMRLSQREQGMTYAFFTSFSVPPAELKALLFPFLHGNPYPLVSVEIVGYAGALPLVFALLAPLWRRNRAVAFWSVMAVVGLTLALGTFNPAYHLLWHVPILNRFRAPGRYLLWLDLAIAILAATAVDALLAFTRPPEHRAWRVAPLAVLPLMAAAGFSLSRLPLDRLLESWHWLPRVWLSGTALLLLALALRPPRDLWLGLVTGLALVDLAAFSSVYGQTYNALMPGAELTSTPASVGFLRADAGTELHRVYTSERITPGLPVMRESLFPNIQWLHGVQGLGGYFPLLPGAQNWLKGDLDPRLLDLLNVRYVLVPQEGPPEGLVGVFVAEDPFAPSLAGHAYDLPPVDVAAVEVEGYLLHVAGLARGTPVGEVILQGAGGEQATWPLLAGVALAQGPAAQSVAFDPGSKAQLPQSIRSWPSLFGEAGDTGHTYRARYDLPQPMEITRVEVRALLPTPCLRLERMRLFDPAGQVRLLSDLVGQGDHTLVYNNPGVSIYRNEQAGPRAFLVHRTSTAGPCRSSAPTWPCAPWPSHRASTWSSSASRRAAGVIHCWRAPSAGWASWGRPCAAARWSLHERHRRLVQRLRQPMQQRPRRHAPRLFPQIAEDQPAEERPHAPGQNQAGPPVLGVEQRSVTQAED